LAGRPRPEPRTWLASHRAGRLLIPVVLVTALSLAGCGSSRTVVQPTSTGSPLPSPTASASPSASATPSAEPSSTPSTTTKPPAPGFDTYAAMIPKFPPAPTPVPVTLTPKQPGMSAFAYEIPTTQPVAFLTIDDGATRHPMAADLLRAAKVPVTLFLTTNYVSKHQDYFRELRDTGYAEIENHTIDHKSLPGLGRGGAKNELCAANDNLANWFGRKPVFFRPPYGNYNDSTLLAGGDCGLKAGFYWRETVDQGIVHYQRADKKIHAGDIILMHFRSAFPDDFIAALRAIAEAGLTPAFLSDYVRVPGYDTPPVSGPDPSSGPQTPPAALVATEPDRPVLA
jgi:peptidoglycan/xylan/chitin deacetylase (PgdA/CDA1 family)